MTLAEARQAKLDHICKRPMLREGERFLDIGAGWGGLRGRVTMDLCDYRELPETEPWDKVASVGMFEHVGQALLPACTAKMGRPLAPGGLLLNHGITAGGTRNKQLGAGMGDFIERCIFPGGELEHMAHLQEVLSEAGLEALDVENLRAHAVGLERRARSAARRHARRDPRRGGAGLPALPGRQRDVLRARLDFAVPDARRQARRQGRRRHDARRTIGLLSVYSFERSCIYNPTGPAR